MKRNLTVPCSKTSLAQVREFVKTQLGDLGIVGKVREQIILATDEACANCIIHQHQCNRSSTIEIAIYMKGNTLYTEIKDTGQAFPIDTYKPKKIEEIIKARRRGGLGLILINKIMDEIKVEERKDHFIYRFGKHLNSRS